ncbi:MAG: rubrerythrin [Alphaproteobacteria bacterium CG1_02_46_17]|nr:MAG: rubrerythrin [Alphaproteobacteria bacterium CG1_02_46_17]
MIKMKTGLAMMAVTLSLAVSPAAYAKDLNDQTIKNLETAMHGEAYANLKYMTYADKAREAGNEELAKLFEESANVEANEHFAREADALGLSKGSVKDLEDAMEGEHYENVKMYKEFSEQAEAVGDVEAAELFEQIREDEGDHYEAYRAALAKLNK